MSNFLKYFCYSFASLLVAIFLFILALPTLVSTNWGKQKVSSLVNERINGAVQFQKINLSWLGKQRIEGLKIYDDKQKEVLSAKLLDTDSTLLDFLFWKKIEGNNTINDLNAHIIQDGLGATNIEKALSLKNTPIKTPAYIVTHPVVIDLKSVNGTINLKSPITVNLTGKTFQNNLEGHFDLNASLDGLTVKQLLNLSNEQLLKDAHLKVKANIVNLPVALGDQILSATKPEFAGLLTAILGDKLDVSIDQTLVNGALAFQMNAKSPTLKADLLGTIDEGKFALTKPGHIVLNMTPEMFKQLYRSSETKLYIQLTKPTTLNLALEQVSIPLQVNNLHQATLVAKMEIPQSPFEMQPPFGNFILNNLTANIEASENSKTVSFSLKGSAVQQGQPIDIQVHSTIDRPASFDKLVDSLKQNSKINFNLSGIPVAFLDRLQGYPNTLVSALGKTAKLHVLATPKKQSTELVVQFETDRLSVKDLCFNVDEKLTLLKTAHIQYQLEPALANEFLFKDQPFKLQNSVPVDIKISKINASLTSFSPGTVAIEAELLTPIMNFTSDSKWANGSLKDIKAILNGKSLNDAKYLVVADIVPNPSNAFIKDILGSHTALIFEGNINLSSKTFDLRTNIKSDLALIKGGAQFTDNNRLAITTPFIINYTLTPAALNAMGQMDAAEDLKNPTPIQITINPSKKSIGFEGLSSLHLAGQVKIDNLVLANEGALQDLIIPWDIDGQANSLSFDFGGRTKFGKDSGSLQGSIQMAHWLENNALALDKAQMSAKAKISKLPVSILETLSGKDNLVTLLGSSVDVNLDASYPVGNLDVVLHGNNLDASAALKIGKQITLRDASSPAVIRYHITPERFAAIREALGADLKKEGLVLAEPAMVEMLVGSLSIPTPFNMGNMGFSSTMKLGKLKVQDMKSHQMLAFENMSAKLHTEQLSKQFTYHLEGKQTFASNSDFLLKGNIENALTPDGGLNTKNLSLTLDSKISTFPAGLVCSIVMLDPSLRQKIEALFGETVDADLQIKLHQMNGPLKGTIVGKNGSIDIDGQITHGALTLNKSFNAQFAITPELGKNVLESVIPLLSGVIGSDHPLTLTIQPQGFSIPISQFDKSKMQIGRGELKLGHIKFRNDGQLASILGLLNSGQSDQLSAWFTPLYFNMNSGALHLERMDLLLLNTYPVATWGTVDFAKDFVNVIIGIRGQALTRAFHLEGIDKDYMIQFPFSGTLANASIDKRKATARISALIAGTRGPQGQIIGTFLDIAGGSLSEEKVPNPTTNPLPWDKDNEPSEDKQMSERVKRTNPVKTLEKDAKGLFNTFFR